MSDLDDCIAGALKRPAFYQRTRVVISRQAWALLLTHYAESMGEEPAQRFMDAHFIKADPLPAPSKQRVLRWYS